MALMPAVRARQPREEGRVPWGQLVVAGTAALFLVLLGTGHIRIAPSVSSAALSMPPGGSNPALRWADHPPSLTLLGQLPHWLGVSARPPGSRQLEDGPLLNDTVPFSSQQLGGDAWLYRNLFHGKRSGFFVEVGAGSGGGASRWLAQAAGWRGLLIEGDQGAYSQLSLNRPDAICLHAAVCGAHFASVHWAPSTQQGSGSSGGGVWELMPADRRRAMRGGKQSVEQLQAVQCHPLQYIMDKFGIRAVDLLTFNVAGAELEVLRGLDFSRLAAKVLTVGQGSSSEAATLAGLLGQAGFEAMPAAPSGDSQRQGNWAMFVNRQLRHHLRQAPEA